MDAVDEKARIACERTGAAGAGVAWVGGSAVGMGNNGVGRTRVDQAEQLSATPGTVWLAFTVNA
jgi:hypothetical protein